MKSWLLTLALTAALAPIQAIAGNVTSQMTYSVQRSASGHVDAKDKSEFNGGSRVYFKSLGEGSAVVGWFEEKSGKSTFKNGWTRLILDWPVHISSIVIRKASVGKQDFKGGSIDVEVQNPRGKWVKVFEREDRDIDSPVTIQKSLHSVGPVKGVRINFRSPAPITIGPIDVNS